MLASEINTGSIELLDAGPRGFPPCLNLAYTDKMSMAASTEVRVPLLDDALVRVSSRIPAQLKLRGTTRKYVFKRSMEGVLPREVIHRAKAGFGAPVRAWVAGDLRPLIADALSSERVSARGLFDPVEIDRLIAGQRRRHRGQRAAPLGFAHA